MRQLQLFTTAELATMRDRTASRRYSPAAEEFRRTHQRHRAWGLAQRHAERLRRSRGGPRDRRPAGTGQHPSPARTPHRAGTVRAAAAPSGRTDTGRGPRTSATNPAAHGPRTSATNPASECPAPSRTVVTSHVARRFRTPHPAPPNHRHAGRRPHRTPRLVLGVGAGWFEGTTGTAGTGGGPPLRCPETTGRPQHPHYYCKRPDYTFRPAQHHHRPLRTTSSRQGGEKQLRPAHKDADDPLRI
jgi:hypothetical protein